MLAASAADWQAKLQLSFVRREHTVLSERRFSGPLRVQKPFYPEDDVCHVYVLHPPGGVVGGDRLTIELNVGEHAHTLLTTPGASKFYRSNARHAQVRQRFYVGPGACLEWLPQENVFFDSSYVNLQTRIEMHPSARLVAWDIACLGRPACRESFQHGLLKQRLELFIQNDSHALQQHAPLSGITDATHEPAVSSQRCLTDHLVISGGGAALNAAWGLRGFPVVASLLLYPGDACPATQLLDRIRPLTRMNEQEILSVSLLNNRVIVCRYLGYHGEHAKRLLSEVWSLIRPIMVHKAQHIPRIWLT